jgi:hypothetical protein
VDEGEQDMKRASAKHQEVCGIGGGRRKERERGESSGKQAKESSEMVGEAAEEKAGRQVQA